MDVFSDDYFMTKALDLAQQAFERDEVPIGALIVYENRIIGKGFNQVEMLRDVTSHAEMICITAACNAIGGKFLTDCTVYITLEPCTMCAGAIELARPKKVVYGASEPKKGYFSNGGTLSPKIEVKEGVLFGESIALMQQFFASKRG